MGVVWPVMLICVSLSFVFCSAATAVTVKENLDDGSVLQSEDSLDDIVADDAIVVTADRYGEAKVGSEAEFDEGEIASQGTDNIQDLLTRLRPFIDDSEDEPIFLVNGKPAGFDRSVLSYSTEALSRLSVLKPDAAAKYGFPPNKRVVNLVLKRSFSSLNADIGLNWATAGGQFGGNIVAGRVAISGANRWNVNARITRDSALRKSARDIFERARASYTTEPILGIDDRQIDPTLGLARGEYAADAVTRTDLGTATTGDKFGASPDTFETLLPSRRNMSLNIGVTRPIAEFNVSLNINASRNSSAGLRGLVVAPRHFASAQALQNRNSSDSLGGTLTLNGLIGGWQTNFSFNYGRNWSDNLIESGIDVLRSEQLADGETSPLNSHASRAEQRIMSARNLSRGDNLRARFNVRKNVFNLPAGPLSVNFSANAHRGNTKSRRRDNGTSPSATSEAARKQLEGQALFSVPISHRAEAKVPPLGDLTVDLSISGQTMSNSRPQKRFGGNVNWSPFAIVRLRGSLEYVETAPSFEQLDGPIVTATSRIFDYARAETAEPVRRTGGNPDLGPGRRRNLALNVTARPFNDQTLSLTLGYRRTIAKGAITSFPELTPIIEAAFPERVIRDAEGRLIEIDARAINIARDTDARLNSGIALRLPRRSKEAGGSDATHPFQFSVSFNHRWRLKSKLLTRPGVPVIDQLAESGQPRHSLSFQISAGKRGVGASLNGNWSSPARVFNANQSFLFKPPATLNLSMFAEPNHLFGPSEKSTLTKGLRISFDVNNLFNRYRRVLLDDGSIPPGYSRNEIDPLGRTIRLSLRKRF